MPRISWRQTVLPYAVVAAGLAILTAVLIPLLDEDHAGLAAMLFLALTLLVAATWGYGPGLTSAVAANLCVNFFFVPPVHTFTVNEPANLISLMVFLAVAAFGAFMLSRWRQALLISHARESETAVLLEAARAVAHAPGPKRAVDRLCEVIARSLGAQGCAVVRADPPAVLGSTNDTESGTLPDRGQQAVIREALKTGEPARLLGAHKRARAVAIIPIAAAADPAVLVLRGVDRRADLNTPLMAGLVDEVSATLERLRLAAEAQRASELEKIDEFKSALLSTVSHDLRSPLTAVKAAISSLRDESVEWSDDDRKAFERTIERQTDRLTATVSNLLQISRLESGLMHPAFEAIELKPFLTDVSESVAGLAGGRSIQVRADSDRWFRADYGLMTQAVGNLVENAAKYSTPGGPICLSGTTEPGRCLIEVADAGPGIPEEDLPHVFEKFYRGSQTKGAPGSGLGLAMVEALVQLCGGSTSVHTSPSGTTFTISLPAVTGHRLP